MFSPKSVKFLGDFTFKLIHVVSTNFPALKLNSLSYNCSIHKVTIAVYIK